MLVAGQHLRVLLEQLEHPQHEIVKIHRVSIPFALFVGGRDGHNAVDHPLIDAKDIAELKARILASGLSFLGLGVRPPEPEWGLMLNTLRTAIYVQPWLAALPGVMIFVTSITFNLLSDSLRSAMDGRTRRDP